MEEDSFCRPAMGRWKAEGVFEEKEIEGAAQFKVVFDAIRELMTPPEPKRRSIGFKRGKENG